MTVTFDKSKGVDPVDDESAPAIQPTVTPAAAPAPAPAIASTGDLPGLEPTPAPATVTAPTAAPAAGTPVNTVTPSFLRRGAAARAEFESAEAATASAKEAFGKSFRFMITRKFLDVDFKLTFLDGALDEKGMLDIPMFYEHTIPVGKGWRNYPCTDGVITDEPCPLCLGGDKAAFVGAMTIIDHNQWTNKEGVVQKDIKRLYMVKRGTIKQLTKMAQAQGGLRGCTFNVSRTSENAVNVGDVFILLGKLTEKQLATWGDKGVALNYETEIVFRSPAELRKEGVTVAAPTGPPAAGAGQSPVAPPGGGASLDDEIPFDKDALAAQI